MPDAGQAAPDFAKMRVGEPARRADGGAVIDILLGDDRLGGEIVIQDAYLVNLHSTLLCPQPAVMLCLAGTRVQRRYPDGAKKFNTLKRCNNKCIGAVPKRTAFAQVPGIPAPTNAADRIAGSVLVLPKRVDF